MSPVAYQPDRLMVRDIRDKPLTTLKVVESEASPELREFPYRAVPGCIAWAHWEEKSSDRPYGEDHNEYSARVLFLEEEGTHKRIFSRP